MVATGLARWIPVFMTATAELFCQCGVWMHCPVVAFLRLCRHTTMAGWEVVFAINIKGSEYFAYQKLLNLVAVSQSWCSFFRHSGFKPTEVFTHQHSTAERGGCFQRHLFVCQFICLFVNTITYKRLNVGWWNLAVWCTVQKPRPNLNLGSKVRVTRDQNDWHFFGAVLRGAVLGALHAVYVWENIFSIASVAGPAVGHTATSVNK